MFKKGELSLQVVVIAVIALLVLVVLMFIFQDQTSKSSKSVDTVRSNLDQQAQDATNRLKNLVGGSSSANSGAPASSASPTN